MALNLISFQTLGLRPSCVYFVRSLCSGEEIWLIKKSFNFIKINFDKTIFFSELRQAPPLAASRVETAIKKQKMTEEITVEQKDIIKNLCKELLCQIPSNLNLKGFCYTICFPLSFYLESKEFNNSILYGTYDNFFHYWINLNNCSDMIIDPTITQFKSYTGEQIYIGSRKNTNNNHNEQEDEPDIENIRFRKARVCWIKKMQNNIDLKKINIEIAIKVINGIGKNGLPKNSKYTTYCQDIKRIINSMENVELKDNFKSKLPESIFN